MPNLYLLYIVLQIIIPLNFVHVGHSTASTVANNIFLNSRLANTPPRILGPNSLFVTLGEEAVLVFNVTDDKNTFNVSTLNGLPVNSTLTPMAMDGFTEFVFRWNIYEVVNRSLMFEARDELDAVSVLNVQVQICACQNGGNCTLGGLLSTTASTIVLNCECSEGQCYRRKIIHWVKHGVRGEFIFASITIWGECP